MESFPAEWVLASGIVLCAVLSADPLTIVSPPNGAKINSAFAAIDATAPAGACFDIVLDDQRIDRACADSSEHLEAVIHAAKGNHVLRLADKNTLQELAIVVNPPPD